MSNLPAKPEFSRTASTWPEPGDDRRPSGPGRASPDRYSHPRGDRDRDRDARDNERGSRSRYASSGQRSPLPPRSVDTYIAGSRESYHGREYRGYDDARARDDRRKDWDRDRERDRDWGHYRRDRDIWTPRRDYSPNHPTSSRRGYDPRESDWRSRDDYRRDRDRGRERSRDRDDQRSRDRKHDRRPASPSYRPAPLSPHRDYRHDPHSLSRQAQPHYVARGRRSTSPQSAGSRSRRSSPVSRARRGMLDTHPSRAIPGPPKSPSPRRGSPSPSRHPRSTSSPTRSARGRQSPETAPRLDDTRRENGPAEGGVVLDGQTENETATEPPGKGKDRRASRAGEPPGKAGSPGRTGSPLECHQQLIPTLETVAMPSSEAAVTQPYLPTIPRFDAKPKFSGAYQGEYNRLEAHRVHAAAECRRCLKASRRAFHELEMTTQDLRAAQQRRELAEAHRKKAHHGQLGIDAETMQWTSDRDRNM